MRNWFLRGLQRGVQTTRYPSGVAEEADNVRLGVRFTAEAVSHASALRLSEVCPVSALFLEGSDANLRLVLDLGRCIACGACIEEAPEAMAWATGPGLARRDREALRSYRPVGDRPGRELEGRPGGSTSVTPQRGPMDNGRALGEVAQAFDAAADRYFGRSAHILQIDAGSCNACESELLALTNPYYDLHRLGLFFTNSPRHADILLVTGAVTQNMRRELLEAYRAMPGPKLVVAMGACAIDGGIFRLAPRVVGGVEKFVPVDVYIPGCPPDPYAILHGLLLAVGRAAEPGQGQDGREETEAVEVREA